MQGSALTESQSQILAGQVIAGDVPLYNMAFSFVINGPVSVEEFRAAFRALLAQCDSLRTTFRISHDGTFSQVVNESIAFELPFSDESGNSEFDLDAWLQARSRSEIRLADRAFDSELLKLSEDRFVWFLVIHHCVTDALSFPILLDRMSENYSQVENASSDSAPPLFSDYVAFESKAKTGKEYGAIAEKWQEETGRSMPLKRISGKPVRQKTTESIRVTIDLGVDRKRQVDDFLSRPGYASLTPQLARFNFYTALLGIMMTRLCEQSQVSIGSPVHNRVRPEHKITPGLFIEFFLINLDIRPGDSFSAVYKKASQETLKFLKNARPGAGTADISRSLQVILNYIALEFGDFCGIPVEAEWVHPGHIDASHAMRLHIYDDKSLPCPKLLFDFNVGEFSAGVVEELPQRYLSLLDSVLEDPEAQIVADLADSSGTISLPDRATTLVKIFEESAGASPGIIAVREGNLDHDYRSIDKASNQVANFLIGRGVRKGARVAVNLPRSLDFVNSVLGILKAGAVFVPVPVDQPPGRSRKIIEDAEPAILFSESETDSIHLSGVDTVSPSSPSVRECATDPVSRSVTPADLAYIIYTSGSTGTPKGVCVSHAAITNYVSWAAAEYRTDGEMRFPFFTSTGFDLTLTSLLVPLAECGALRVYPESGDGLDTSIKDVFDDDLVTHIKLTPSHLALAKDLGAKSETVKVVIVGGENFSANEARFAAHAFPNAKIYNEYGPTEAAVGCVAHQFDPACDIAANVPIGRAITNVSANIFDKSMRAVANGATGELYLEGASLADGYWNDSELTSKYFIEHPDSGMRMYATGDLAKMNPDGDIEFLGRTDDQVKINGVRVELSEIESAIQGIAGVERAVVMRRTDNSTRTSGVEGVINCTKCGIPSNYPGTKFNERGICALCTSFAKFEDRAKQYFRSRDDLRAIIDAGLVNQAREYDCLVLLSGGKDSTYMLAQIVEMGYKVLAFTLDNGYISEGAKANIKRVTEQLGVSHVYGSTPAMDAIFVDSLRRHSNVCNGCFKTIYTLASQTAVEKGIPFVITGLSRGQFFETRLTEELFLGDRFDPERIDETILDARKAYHAANDAVKVHLDTSPFSSGEVFEKVTFVDFYRFFDTTLEEIYEYLAKHLPWIRPTDTGRSTNCLINKVGISVHKKEKGYSNYAYPYSWDVRMGHKSRDEALTEINEEIDEEEVKSILEKIGYSSEASEERLTAIYQSATQISSVEFRKQLSNELPDFMIPGIFQRIESMPLTANGKIDRTALGGSSGETNIERMAAATDLEELVLGVWSDVLNSGRIGVTDDFLSLGGQSLAAIRITARLNHELDMELPLNLIFKNPTVRSVAVAIEKEMSGILASEKSAELRIPS